VWNGAGDSWFDIPSPAIALYHSTELPTTADGEFKGQKIIASKDPIISNQVQSYRGAIEQKQGDVIITKDSEDPRDIGIPALVKEDLNDVICGYHLTVIKAHDPSLSGFIHRSIQSQSTKAHFFVESPGITRYGLDQDAIGDIPICVPPLEEREDLINAINQETSRIDTLIARKSRFTQLLTEKILAIVTHSFEYEDTRWVRLQHVCNVISRPVNQKNGESYTRLGLYNRGRGAFKKAVADNEDMGDSDFFWVEEGDLILSGQFAWEGAVAIATNQHDKCVVSHRFPIIHGRKGEALTEYLFAFFRRF
jgi:restriction endonuclease S subunit